MLGGGEHGHLGLIMPPDEYLALAGVAYEIPERPDIPQYAGVEAGEREEWSELYKAETSSYFEAHGLANQLRNLITKAVPEIYMGILAHPVHRFATVSPRDMLQHVVTAYGEIQAEDLGKNLQRLTAPWDPTTPIETVFTNGTKCRYFAEEGGDPISDRTYMRLLFDVITASGVLTRALEDWDAKPVAQKTLPEFITHFTRANKLRCLRDQSLKSTLTANPAHAMVANVAAGPTAKANIQLHTSNWGYCWSHGINCTHNSAQCSNPAPGHVKEATIDNLMGGRVSMQRPPNYVSVFKNPNPNPQRTKNRNKQADKATQETKPDKSE
jgi:hypothetical protein